MFKRIHYLRELVYKYSKLTLKLYLTLERSVARSSYFDRIGTDNSELRIMENIFPEEGMELEKSLLIESYIIFLIYNILENIFVIEYHLCFECCLALCTLPILDEYLCIEIRVCVSLELGRCIG